MGRESLSESCALLLPLVGPRRKFAKSVWWNLTPDGVCIEGGPAERTPGEPATIRRIWREYNEDFRAVSRRFGVPVELIVATVATESLGNKLAVRTEPGYVSDDASPSRVSVGLCQTLISTARESTGDMTIDRTKLFTPRISIHAGTSYIRQQWKKTLYCPVLVCSSYNAGSIRHEANTSNKFRIRCHPSGTGRHITRFLGWFGDACAVIGEAPPIDCVSFSGAFRGL